MTSLSPEQAGPEALLALNRSYGSIENQLHYVRDWSFDEDRSQVRTKAAPWVMATLRNVAISLLRLAGMTKIASALREMAAKPHLAVALMQL